MSYENEISFKLAHGELTELIFDEFCYGDPFTVDDSVDLSDIETANTLNDRPIFLEGVIRRFSDMGLHFTLSDTEALIDEIKKRYKARMGKNCPRTVVEWFRGTPPGVTNRRNNYELCYALEMNLQETAEFFQKCFLTIPFNYKDASDAVFFYCLLKNRDYAIISSMLEAVEDVNESTAGETETQIHARNPNDEAALDAYIQLRLTAVDGSQHMSSNTNPNPNINPNTSINTNININPNTSTAGSANAEHKQTYGEFQNAS